MVYRHKPKQDSTAFKKSMLAMYIMAAGAPSLAQETVDEESETLPLAVEEITVSGVRQNLENAQEIKRQADTFVDAISAEDIGSLPDRSVVEALQRMPGVAIERFAGPDDPDHFSVEGSGAIIRGMTATRSEFNGRDSFSANSGRGLNFQDVSPELMGSVEVFKNQTADMVEGGIGGTINLNTRKPFDADDRVLGFSADYSAGDLTDEWTPTVSALFSDRWDTESAGEFGFLINVAHSELIGTSHGIQSDAFVQYWARDLPGAEEFVGPTGDGRVWIPNASNLLMKEDDRRRTGGAASLQWESPDDSFLATFEYIRSDAELSWHEQAVKYQGGFFNIDDRETRPLEGTEFQFDEDGLFQGGFLVAGAENDGGWRVNDVNTDHVPHAWSGPIPTPQWGHPTQYDSRVYEDKSLVEDFSFNMKWSPTEKLDLEADFQYIDAEASNNDLVVHTANWAAQRYDTAGATPSLTLMEPWLGKRDNNPDLFAEGWPGFSNDPAGDSNFFQDPNSYYWRSAMDHYSRSEGDSTAVRLDGTYHFDDAGIIQSVQAGVRYADREQIVRNTNWNWGAISPEWGSEPLAWLADVESQQNDFEAVDWSDFMHGDVVDIPGNTTLHATEEFVRSLWGPNPEREMVRTDGNTWVSQPNQPNVDSEFGLFEPQEISDISETNQAVYVRLNFGDDAANLRYSGNIGLRYFKLERESNGFVAFPDLVPDFPAPEGIELPLTREATLAYLQDQVDNGEFPDLATAIDAEENNWIGDRNNYLPDEQRAFGNNQAEFLLAKSDVDMFLPSFNIKVELTEDLVGRFALAKAVSLPDIGDVRNNKTVGASEVVTIRPDRTGEEEPLPEETLIERAFVNAWQGSGGNPYLQPMESVQYDMSLEWYFADVGSLTGTIFHKDLSNIFVQGSSFQELTNPTTGITQPVDVSSTRNGGDAKMDGFELAYQQFFDGLPAPWDGFGVQATYTYIDAGGVPNNEIPVENEGFIGDDFTDTGIRVTLDTIPLQGQSKDTVNLVAMYEKYGWNARLAYNWRSRYLLTTRDVISKAPLFYDDHGQVDGSIFYDISDNFTVGLQGTNLTNSQSETIMLLNNEGLEAGRSWFQADRRLALVLRAEF